MKLILILLVLLVFISLYIRKFESFITDYSDYTTIDRIKTADNLYSYCLAGNISCPNGSLTLVNDEYSGGKTYNYICDSSGIYAECQGNFQYNNKGSHLDWYTPTREISFPFSDEYKGFTVPYSYIPVDISGKYMNFYNSSGNVIDNINKCDMLLTTSMTDDCKLNINKIYDQPISTNSISTDGSILTNSILTNSTGTSLTGTSLMNTSSTNTSSTNTSSTNTSSNGSSKKCIADYGSKTGDPLCCNQKGVLQKWSSEYVCPSTAPSCSGYICGEKYGTCN
jgi:hypothetical protein